MKALTTLRSGGYSKPPFHECNLALHVGDKREHVLANRALLCDQLMLPEEPKWLQQVHGNNVVDATIQSVGPVEADAAYTTAKGVICAVLTADCLPVLLADRDGTCVGVVHAGWRGLLAGVIQNTVQAMSTAARPVFAWLGPAIGPRAFEVGIEVYEAFIHQRAEFEIAFTPTGQGKWLFDIYQAAKIILASADITDVYGGNFCTYTDHERFYSYRRAPRTGRMATIIWMN